MMRVEMAPAGARILRHGERGAELYVLVSGRAEVRLGEDRLLDTIVHGDAFGEMAAIRDSARCADVIVVEDAAYLVLDAACILRLGRECPRIAATFFENLACSLSDRLERTTHRLATARHGGNLSSGTREIETQGGGSS